MQLKSYRTLSSDEQFKVRQFFEMYKGPTLIKNDHEVHDYMTMRDLNSGDLFFSAWDENEVIATLGVVLVAIPYRKEIYLTGAASKFSQLSLKGMKNLVEHCVGLANAVPLKIKMGVGPKLEWLMPYVESWGFELKERMHHLSYTCVAHDDFREDTLLLMVPLCQENKLKYIEIHNRSFANVPNGGLITEEDVEGLLVDVGTNMVKWNGLLYSHETQSNVGFYELKMEEDLLRTGWIEAIGIDDAYQRKGLGDKALFTCIQFLQKEGAKQVELLVMDSNKRAESLYLSRGFQLKQVFNHWYEKVIHI